MFRVALTIRIKTIIVAGPDEYLHPINRTRKQCKCTINSGLKLRQVNNGINLLRRWFLAPFIVFVDEAFQRDLDASEHLHVSLSTLLVNKHRTIHNQPHT